jgi:hypothetical protein
MVLGLAHHARSDRQLRENRERGLGIPVAVAPPTAVLVLPQRSSIAPPMAADSTLRRKRIVFDAATWHALHHFALDRGVSVQQLADEAFRDLLRKHRRPVTLRDSLRESLRMIPANEQPKATVHRLRRRG